MNKYLGELPELNFFSKKVHKKLAKRYTQKSKIFSRENPHKGGLFSEFSGKVYAFMSQRINNLIQINFYSFLQQILHARTSHRLRGYS